MTKSNQRGFNRAIVLVILLLVVVAAVAGWAVYRNTHKATKTAKSSTQQTSKKTEKTVQYSAPTQGTQYLTIKEWGVRGSYVNMDSYSYKLSSDGKLATVISKLLADKDAGCKNFGAGQIRRLAPSDGSAEDGSGPSAEQAAKTSPNNYTHIGNYYYQFVHDQAACGSAITADVQNQANDAVKAMVKKLEATPKQ